ncbi:hypothetical protein FXB68_11400 [Aggregatibacter actinomycetemcomitans]|uniref:Uncharacterized protein n=1 Tax=Aggregatibacter actinomycetemcomitans TaxID=714 RepID=A0AB74N2A2_AGGAC|nr:hypothetical protein CQR80_05445 [Aggregatibacter actinomycetemcomitans]PHO22739.1 hypothetical protein CQR79_06145 [Aggregatibacter actinomycetemcomitans]TYA20173.1 hypothetical protein FXE08_11385 [Aggregatibacter actinomycetemcomitans]TYA33891.1 hypothetical protein FXB68_11400 [Aggregatibacter actinomycetemcomitans]TYA37974.1 hypothetical protein FXB79_11300 [Aggregatibacter actinomycetemcomitans]
MNWKPLILRLGKHGITMNRIQSLTFPFPAKKARKKSRLKSRWNNVRWKVFMWKLSELRRIR